MPVTLASAACAVLVTAALAVADEGTTTDPQGDSAADGPSRDLKSIAHGHTADGKLVHRIAVVGEIKVTPNKAPLMQLDTEGDNVAEYRVYVGPNGGRVEDMVASTIVPAKARKVSRHKMKYVFGPTKIGNPDSYDWDVLAVSGAGLVDRAPDATQLTHSLSP
jgi:hypothetical protein